MYYIYIFAKMSSSEEDIENDMVVRKEYTDRHKRRLAHKQSLSEIKKVLEKVLQNRNYGISDDSEINFSHNLNIDSKNIVALQDSNNIINIQMSAEDKSVTKENFNKYNTSEESEVLLENEKNVSIKNKACKRK